MTIILIAICAALVLLTWWVIVSHDARIDRLESALKEQGDIATTVRQENLMLKAEQVRLATTVRQENLTLQAEQVRLFVQLGQYELLVEELRLLHRAHPLFPLNPYQRPGAFSLVSDHSELTPGGKE